MLIDPLGADTAMWLKEVLVRARELVHPGAARSADETAIYFPEERIVFAAHPVIDLPVSLLPAPREIVGWLRTVDALVRAGAGLRFSVVRRVQPVMQARTAFFKRT
ncbi:MAG: hypothetical protein ACRD3G_20375 [Vicinamibacterales bacterium]